jgi:hypothetical protein
MNKFLLACLMIMTTGTLILGKNHWNKQVDSVLATLNDETIEIEKSMPDNPSAEKKIDKERLLKLDKLHALPSELRPLFKEKIENDQPVQLLIIGSASTSEKEGAWPNLVERRLKEFYSDSLIKVRIKEIPAKTSKQVIAGNLHKDLAGLKLDVLLFEPFLLYDNQKIKITERIHNLSVILKEFKNQNPDIKIILQPSNPIFGAHYYLQEESELEHYSKQQKHIYLNHWEAWPDSDDKDIRNYLTKDYLPSDRGNEVWADYVIDFFIKDLNEE